MYFRSRIRLILKPSYFIALKLLKKQDKGKAVARPIVNIAVATIALALIVNLITISVVIGFQKEVRDKVVGFGAHAVITKIGENSIMESTPLRKDIKYQMLFQSPKIRQIDDVAYKTGVLQAMNEESEKQEIQGVVFKGVGEQYDLSFFGQFLKEGELPHYSKDSISNDILISETIAKSLGYKVGDNARSFFLKDKPIKRVFRIVGIYNTGYEEMDKKMIISDLKNIQKLNDWGLQVALRLKDTLVNGNLIVEADVSGDRNAPHQLKWDGHVGNFKGFYFFPEKDTVIRIKLERIPVGNFEVNHHYIDSAQMKVTVNRKVEGTFPLVTDEDNRVKKEYLDDEGLKIQLEDVKGNSFVFEMTDGTGDSQDFISGYEIVYKDFKDIQPEVENLRRTIIGSPEFSQQLSVSGILDTQSDIFNWLSFLDINVWIILVLMLFIGIINMSSALLVMILVRTRFIGLMKAIGANNAFIRKIFIQQIAFLMFRALLWGNLIGIGFAVLQNQFHLIKLNPEVYYLDAVPIQLNVFHIILLNIATLAICLLALMLPARFVTKISPIKSLKFN